MSAAFASLRPSELADATPQLNVLQRVGGSIGTAVLAVVLQRSLVAIGHPATPSAVAGAYGTAFWWAMGIAAFAIVPSYILMQAERRARAERRAAARAEDLTPAELGAEAMVGV